jgi:hypothetical protein
MVFRRGGKRRKEQAGMPVEVHVTGRV